MTTLKRVESDKEGTMWDFFHYLVKLSLNENVSLEESSLLCIRF